MGTYVRDVSDLAEYYQLQKMARRIAMVITRSDTIGGAPLHVRDLALALRELSIDVVVLVGQEGPFTDELSRCDIRYYPLRYLVRDIRPWSDLKAVFELRRVLKLLKPDLVTVHTSKAGWLGRLVAKSLGIPCIFTVHGWAFTEGVPVVRRRLYMMAEKIAQWFTDRIITVSEYDRHLAIKLGVVPSTKMITVYNGIPDVPKELRADPGRQPARLVMVARFEEPKDHATLVYAMSQVDAEWYLDFIGDGPTRGAIEDLVRRLGLQDRIRFLGWSHNVARDLASYQMFVLVSKWEGMPLAVLEAMRAGLPVVATNTGGIAEVVVDGRTGYLVARENPMDVAAKLRLLLSDPDLRIRMGQAGRIRFEELFTFRKMVERTIEVYMDVLLKSKKI